MKQTKETGLIQVYTGDGKGKSTAAFGLALRAYGAGLRVTIIQFMKKGEWYGEIETFRQLPEIRIYSYGSDRMVKKGHADELNISLAAEALAKAKDIMVEGMTDVLILDELNNALYFDLVSEEEVLTILKSKPQDMEIVITFFFFFFALVELADLVTEMVEVKHPYQKGVQGRKGIEY
jgi:cob(I)alamin adenosyltransferase